MFEPDHLLSPLPGEDGSGADVDNEELMDNVEMPPSEIEEGNHRFLPTTWYLKPQTESYHLLF